VIDRVIVGGVIYKVDFVDRIIDAEHEFDGLIEYATARIQIATGADPQFERAVLLHELVHALLKHAGQNSGDEKVVTALGYGLLALIRQNPDLMRYLIEGAP
jgi:hypothetical protein